MSIEPHLDKCVAFGASPTPIKSSYLHEPLLISPPSSSSNEHTSLLNSSADHLLTKLTTGLATAAYSDQSSFPLSRSAFLDFEALLSDSELYKLRYNYDDKEQLLTLRMPISEFHENVIGSFLGLIRARLDQLLLHENDNIRAFVRNILYTGSGTVKLSHGERSPDASWRHYQARLPSVVLEVAKTQSLKSLDKAARAYLKGSKGAIQVVIGINIGFSSHADVLIWRPQVENHKLTIARTNQQLLDQHGQIVPGTTVHLSLSDFGYGDVIAHLPDPPPAITVTAADFEQILTQADLAKDLPSTDTIWEPDPDLQIDSSSPSSNGQFRSDDEADMIDAEPAVDAMQGRNDADYRP